MPTHADEYETDVRRPSDRPNGGIGQAAKEISDRLKTIIALEGELAKLEIKRKVAPFAVGIGMLVGAAVFALFMLGFLFAGVAAAFDTLMPRWLADLATAGILLLVTLILALLGRRSLRKGPPVPKRAIEEAKLTTSALKSDGTT